MKLARPAALVLALTLALGLTGCAPGLLGQTQVWYTAADGTSTEAGAIAIRHVLIVADDEGNGTVLATFVNRGSDDQLVEVRVDTIPATLADGPIDLPTRGRTTIGPDSSRADVEGLSTPPGRMASVEFIFRVGPRATVNALVRPHEGIYEGILDTE